MVCWRDGQNAQWQETRCPIPGTKRSNCTKLTQSHALQVSPWWSDVTAKEIEAAKKARAEAKQAEAETAAAAAAAAKAQEQDK